MLASDGTIIAALALDGGEHDQHVIASARDLALAMDVQLHLVHAVDWLAPEPWVAAMPAVVDEFWDVNAVRENEQYAVRRAEARMRREVQRLAASTRGLRCDGRIVFGAPTSGILSAARQLQADLIVVGAARTEPGPHLPAAGTSTATRILADAAVPVLVVHRALPDSVAHGGARIVMADDLRPETTCALKVASALAATSGDAALKHVHAYGAPTEHLGEMIVLFWELASSFVDRNVEPGDMNRYEIACRREELARRGAAVAPILRHGHCRYDHELVTGAPVESLAEYARLMHADLVVVGHHRAVHTQPWSFGHVTPHAMLGMPAAVLMVPASGERLADRLTHAALRRVAS